ncbi:hypothetical protein MRS44_016980 [Fusarium solani]|uniref:uncharacterized protein n=1 Tax=Fusarium solani TaxID=169388 RepID=UPI0032C40DF0|nr:hypothetical protein MRS44_016980 [Fusarium solani]
MEAKDVSLWASNVAQSSFPAANTMDVDSQDIFLGQVGSETSLTLHSSPCPSRLSTQSSFLSGSTPQTPPRKILNLDENPTPGEIATFPFELFNGELRAGTPSRTNGAKVAWWWVKGFRMRLKSNSKKLRWVCRLANIIKHLRDIHGVKLPSNFFSIMDRQYPDKNKPLAAGRKRKTKGTVLYVCRLCPRWSHGHRTTAVHHIKNRHAAQPRPPPPPPSPISSNQRSLPAMFASIPTPDSLRQVFNRQAYNEAVIGLLTQRRAPFSAVEWNELKDLALACNLTIGDQLITFRRQAMRHIAENHVFYRDQIKDKLAIASSPIHISTDLWTSPHRHALLAVCAQWVDQDYQLQKALLGLPECRDNHSGERQADLIMSILETFGIMSKLGYHTGDNATSNDTCLESIARRLKENLNIDYDPKKRRIRCIGHIINLSLQAFLLRSSNEALIAALEAAYEATSEDLLIRFSHALTTRRRRGRRRLSRSDVDEDYLGIEGIPALRKLHGLAVWTRCSSLNSQLWDDEVGLRLGIDNETRWSSWYHVLDKLFKKKAHIVQFMHEHEKTLGDNRLTAADWDLLQKTMTEDVPVYSAALLLDPSKREAYIKQNWPDECHRDTLHLTRVIRARESLLWGPQDMLMG